MIYLSVLDMYCQRPQYTFFFYCLQLIMICFFFINIGPSSSWIWASKRQFSHCWDILLNNNKETLKPTSGAIREAFPPLLTHMLLKGRCRLQSLWARQQPKSVITKRGQPSAQKQNQHFYIKLMKSQIDIWIVLLLTEYFSDQSQTPTARCLIWDPCEQHPVCTDGRPPRGAAAPSESPACGQEGTLPGTVAVCRGSYSKEEDRMLVLLNWMRSVFCILHLKVIFCHILSLPLFIVV